MTKDQAASVSLLAASTIVMALGLSACGGEGGTADPDDELLSRTVVTLNEDGTETVREFFITKQEHARDLELRRLFVEGKHTAAVVRDNSCSDGSIWLFDATFNSGHQICFIANPRSTNWQSVKLRDYKLRGSSTGWAGKVRSFWAGPDTALFSDALHCNYQVSPWVRQDEVNGCVQFSQVLSLRED
jgi:hypothetical protein